MRKLCITVVGSGYVGTPTAGLLANIGHTVYAVDIDESKIASLKSGKAPFHEPGLDKLVEAGIQAKTLIPTGSYAEALTDSSIVISAVGTPDNPDGSPNLDYVMAALKSIAEAATGPIIYVQKSTVPVGTGRQIIKAFEELSDQPFSYVSSPEFLREGNAIADSIAPDRIVVGGDDKAANQQIADLFMAVSEQREQVAKITGIAPSNVEIPQIFQMGLESAELTKVTANAFLALKISFANSIAKLADATGSDIIEVMDAVGADKRIGRAFLNAGRGYGGGCFPKDVSGLISSAATHRIDLSIMNAAAEVNFSMPGYVVNKVKQELGTLRHKKVAVLGLAFKANTSDARKSPGVKIANILASNGARVCAYDPEATEEAEKDLRKDVSTCQSWAEAAKGSDAIIIATEWEEFRNIDLTQIKKLMSGTLLLDAVNLLESNEVAKAGLRFIGIGRKGSNS